MMSMPNKEICSSNNSVCNVTWEKKHFTKYTYV